VSVRVWGEPESLHFTVADTGPGIPDDKLPLVFSKYYQAGPPGSGSGTGLGLAIAREVLQAHGGSISVENARPSGAVFHVSLPAPTPSSSPQKPPARLQPPSFGDRRTRPRREVVAGDR
jgi:signal transduction histidine kinase